MTRSDVSEDQRIANELRKHTTKELIEFREKLVRIDTPRAWAIRFGIIKVLLERSGHYPAPLTERIDFLGDTPHVVDEVARFAS